MTTSIRRMKLQLLSIMAVLCFMQHTANADTITFNPLELPGTGYTSVHTYSEHTKQMQTRTSARRA